MLQRLAGGQARLPRPDDSDIDRPKASTQHRVCRVERGHRHPQLAGTPAVVPQQEALASVEQHAVLVA
jgi:hypothetical protein